MSKTKAKKRVLTFSSKMLMLCLIPMIAICGLITIFSTRSLESSVETEIERALQIVAVSLDETYSNLYVGDYSQGMTGKITKGDITISGNTELIDALKERTNFEITLYFNQMRLITTLQRQQGGRATGTTGDKDLYARILEGESVFLPQVEIEGNLYYAYYQPLVNADGSVVGAIGVAKDATEVRQTITAQTTRIIMLSVIVLIIVTIIIVMLTTRMTRVMKHTRKFLSNVANGELAWEADAKLMGVKDELGDIYRMSVKLRDELYKVVNNMKDSSVDLIDSADQLTSMAGDTRQSVDVVYQSLEEITKGSATQAEETTVAKQNVERIGEQIGYITEEVDALTMHANQMSEAEQASEHIIGELNTYNQDSIVSVTKVAEQINALHASVKNIQSAITMIQNIADETDLLSLNASIEAARAGDAGRGFAIVAQQISKLAEQSNTTALEVEQIIAGIVTEANAMVEVMGEVRAKMDHQQTKLDETMEKSNAVAKEVNHSLENIDSIRSKVLVLGESGNAIQDIVYSLAAISEQNESSTQNTMGSAERMSHTMNKLEQASESLHKLAGELDETLTVFKL